MTASSFEALIAPLSARDFLTHHYEQTEAVVNRNQPDHYKGLLSLEDVDRFLASADHVFPDVYLVNAANPDLKSSDYCGAGQRIDLRRLYEQFANGATIVLFGIQDRIPALKLLCRAVGKHLSVGCDTNIYLTPPGSHGLRPHYDNHDVFVLQVEGSKSWTIFDSPLPLPMPGQSFAQLHPEPGPVSRQFVLNPGDLLYCPRGLMHDAEAGDAVSLHITLGLKGLTWTDLLIEAVADMALNDVEFRRLLPVGYAGEAWDRAAAADRFRALTARLADGTDTGKLLDRLADGFIADRPAVSDRRLQTLATPPDIGPATRLGAWPDLIFRLAVDEAEIRVVWQGPDLSLPSFTEPDVRFALTTPSFTVADLPGDLDEAGKLVLVRRLYQEGLIQVF